MCAKNYGPEAVCLCQFHTVTKVFNDLLQAADDGEVSAPWGLEDRGQIICPLSSRPHGSTRHRGCYWSSSVSSACVALCWVWDGSVVSVWQEHFESFTTAVHRASLKSHAPYLKDRYSAHGCSYTADLGEKVDEYGVGVNNRRHAVVSAMSLRWYTWTLYRRCQSMDVGQPS